MFWCCCGCGISSDTFSSTLDSKWMIESGTWAVSSSALRCTSPGLIYDSTVHPEGAGGNQQVAVTIQFKAASGANTLRVLLSFQDEDNYLYAQFNRAASGCNSMQLGKVVGGTDTPLGATVSLATIALNTGYTVNVCYSDGRLRAFFPEGGGAPGSDVSVTGTGDKVGFAVTAGDCSFDNYVFNHAKGDGRTDCTECTSSCRYGSHSLSGSVDTCYWDVVSGTWGTNYECTAPGVLRYNRPHPTGKSHMKVAGSVIHETVGDAFRIIVNYLDADNYHYVKATIDLKTLTLEAYKREGGADTLLDSRTDTTSGSFGLGFTYTLNVCFTGTHITATLLQAAVAAETTEIAGGVFAGIGGDAGSPRFAAFQIDKHQSTATPAEPSCPTCDKVCGCLPHLLPPKQYIVDLGAGGWTNLRCAECTDVQGEFVLGDILDNFCGASFRDDTGCFSIYGPSIYRSIGVSLQSDITQTQLQWVVGLGMGTVVTDPSWEDEGASVTYKSEWFGPDECQVFPRTLTKTNERLANNLCGGTMPNTITLDAA